MVKSHKSINKIILSDLKRVYAYQTSQFPDETLEQLLICFKFLFISRSFRSVFFYRLLNIKFRENYFFRSIFLIFQHLFCLEIPYKAEIGEGLLFGHTDCVVIHPESVIGKNATIMQGVSITGNIGKMQNGRFAPMIGDNVFIGAGAKILGPVIVGDNCMIGANAVVLKDIPSNSVAAGMPAKVVKHVKEPFIEIQEKFRVYRIDKNKKTE